MLLDSIRSRRDRTSDVQGDNISAIRGKFDGNRRPMPRAAPVTIATFPVSKLPRPGRTGPALTSASGLRHCFALKFMRKRVGAGLRCCATRRRYSRSSRADQKLAPKRIVIFHLKLQIFAGFGWRNLRRG